MGDPHNNRWGSHENSWGHTSRDKGHKDKYAPSSFFNKIALGVCLFLCGAAGLIPKNRMWLDTPIRCYFLLKNRWISWRECLLHVR